VTYQERPAPVAGVVLWRRTVGAAPGRSRIMPDGCLDLIWDGDRLFVAGPDTAARWHRSPARSAYVALRFAGGSGPALLGVPANELRDRAPDLDQLWPSRSTRALTAQIEVDPVAGLEGWLVERAASHPVDPLGPQVMTMAASGTPIAVMADQLGMSTRQLHRRCLPAFGYGVRRLTRVLRLERALEGIRAGAPLVQVAVRCGYADQAHLCREVHELAGTTPTGLRRELGTRERGEQVHGPTVGITDDGVTHPPEGIPWRQMPFVAGAG
jgi:AraC-like DNA-binding protein